MWRSVVWRVSFAFLAASLFSLSVPERALAQPTEPLSPAESRNAERAALVASIEEAIRRANVDPIAEAAKQYQSIPRSRRFLANAARGAAAGTKGTPRLSLREELIQREMQKQRIAQSHVDSLLLQLQLFDTQRVNSEPATAEPVRQSKPTAPRELSVPAK